MTTSSRDVILKRIQASLGSHSRPRSTQASQAKTSPVRQERAAGYRTDGGLPPDEVRELFRERVSEYRAEVSVSSPAALPDAIAFALQKRGVRRLLLPEGIPSEWVGSIPDGEVELLRDGEGEGALSKGQLASVHGVLTGCCLGIAETGTIVLDAGPTQGRRALSLLPDYHICVVLGSQVVETVPQAVAVLDTGFTSHQRPITLVSGPSATSDIELIRVEGVHGPRNLEVILVEETG